MQDIRTLFDLRFESVDIRPLGETTVLLRMHVTFAARASGRQVRQRVVEVLKVAGGRVTRSEVYIADTAALLRTLEAPASRS